MATNFTIADVLAWARTKPADEKYNYCDPWGCAIAQFGKATGREHLIGMSANDLIALNSDIEEAVNPGARFCGLLGATFGQLSRRLEMLLPAPVTQTEWAAIDAYLTDIETVEA